MQLIMVVTYTDLAQNKCHLLVKQEEPHVAERSSLMNLTIIIVTNFTIHAIFNINGARVRVVISFFFPLCFDA